MTQRQLHFDLPRREALGRDAFVVAGPNALALAMLDVPRNWPGGRLMLVGPEGAGKSHLTQVFAHATQAKVIPSDELASIDVPALASGSTAVEDMDRAAGDRPCEEALFHLLNLAQAEGGRVLVTARTPPRDWPLEVPDLRSRLGAMTAVRIDPPDDALLSAVMMKHFADRQIAPTPGAVAWLEKRLSRRFDAVAQAVALLDQLALDHRQEVNSALVRDLPRHAPHLFD